MPIYATYPVLSCEALRAMFLLSSDVIHLLRCYPAHYQAQYGDLGDIYFARHIFPPIIASYYGIAVCHLHYIAPNLRTGEFQHSPLLPIHPSIPSILPTLHRRATWHMPATWQMPLDCLCTHSDMGITVEMAVDRHYKANLPLVR